MRSRWAAGRGVLIATAGMALVAGGVSYTVIATANADTTSITCTRTDDGTTDVTSCPSNRVTATVTAAGPTVTQTVTATASSTASSSIPASSSPSPTPTPTPTATVVPAGYPNASNTGVPAGTVLTKRGSLKVTASNSTYQNLEIDGCVTFGSGVANVVFRNVLFKSDGCYWLLLNDVGATGIQVIDSEFDSLNNPKADAGLNGSNITLTRVNIHGSVDGIKAGTNMVVQDSYIHDLAIVGNDPHNDGIQSLGTNKLTISHNTIIVKAGATSAIILSTGSADNMRNVLISGNLLAGGANTVYGGYQAGVDVLSRVSNIQILNNRFSTQIFPNSGAFYPMVSIDPPVVVSGNVWFDGPNAGKPVS